MMRLSSGNSHRLGSAEREHLRTRFIECKGTAISTLPQSPFRGISHTKQLVIAVYSVTFTPNTKLRDEG